MISYKSGYYKTPFARILPFVLGLGRDKLYHTFKNFQDVIVRVHTDGVYLNEYPKDILIGTKLGNVKYEGIKTVVLTGLNKIGIIK